jgi:hypothetical protein
MHRVETPSRARERAATTTKRRSTSESGEAQPCELPRSLRRTAPSAPCIQPQPVRRPRCGAGAASSPHARETPRAHSFSAEMPALRRAAPCTGPAGHEERGDEESRGRNMTAGKGGMEREEMGQRGLRGRERERERPRTRRRNGGRRQSGPEDVDRHGNRAERRERQGHNDDVEHVPAVPYVGPAPQGIGGL